MFDFLRRPAALAAAALAAACPGALSQVFPYVPPPAAEAPPAEAKRPRAASKASQMLQAARAAELALARKDAPAAEVYSGRALNALLRSVHAAGRAVPAPRVPLAAGTLERIQVTGGTPAGNAGLLKDVSKIDWPEELQEARYDAPREKLASGLKKAIDAVKDGEGLPATLRRDIDAWYRQLRDKLAAAAAEVPAARYTEARRFLTQLATAVRALKDPNAEKALGGAWAPKGKDVAELVEHMAREGLTFAPATPGDEPAYRALYQALRAFEAGLRAGQR